MYHLLIIDDESTVREGIKTLLPWNKYGFANIHEGQDGKDGLSKLMEFKPDLVLVDIKMPGMSGIELIKKAREEGYQGRFIILSGYSDFEYARSAISLGVKGYLLKPIDEDELETYIVEIVKDMESQRFLKQFIRANEQTAKRDLLKRILNSRQNHPEILPIIEQYRIPITYKTFVVAIISSIRRKQDTSNQGLETLNLEKDFIDDMETVYVEGKLIVIGKGYDNLSFYNHLLQWSERRHKVKGEEYFICVGHNVASFFDICYSYEWAKLLSSYQFILEEQRIIDIHILEGLKNVKDRDEFDEKILAYMEVGDLPAIRKEIQEKKIYYQTRTFSESDVKVNITYRINNMYGRLIKKYSDKKEEFPKIEELLEKIRESNSLSHMMEEIGTFCIFVSDILQTATSNNVVKRMVIYMEKNYEKDLKLESLSKVFSYNSAYLGKLFKKYEGESFNNTLDKIRISNAKRLLLETDLKVYQVSEQVGYSNIDYFYSKFKKYVGISPKEYKSSILNVNV